MPAFIHLSILFVLSLLPVQGFGADKPSRIVSLSLCTDELLLTLAEPNSIASLTWLAADPDFSPVADQVNNIPLNHGQAEEVLAYDPDLILTTAFSATGAVRMLRTMGNEVHVLDVPSSLEGSLTQISQVATLINEEAKGRLLLAQMQAGIQTSQALIQQHEPKRALFLAANGLSYGTGTLRDDFLQVIGWQNVASTLGLAGPGILPLESILIAAPDVVFINTPHSQDIWLAHPLLSHPALQNSMKQTRVIELPDVWFQCAGPSLARAWKSLAQQLTQTGGAE